jgi:nucleotide-binding universal stress UspA family protein
VALVESKVVPSDSMMRSEAVRSPFAESVKNVLFATDFSSTSDNALPYATAICRRFASTLHLVHVVSDASLMMMTGGVDYVSMGTLYDDAHAEAKEKLDQLALAMEGIPHRSYVRHGQVWKSIADIVQDNDIDLIIVGTHGRTGLGKLLLGSVAEEILRHALCPVLTVGPKVSGHAKLPPFQRRARDLTPPELELRRIVFATNFGRNASVAARDAVSLAEEFRARLTLMHVLEHYTELGSDPGRIEEEIRKLRDLIPANAPLQYAPETVVEFGSASERILKVASELEADMIVLSAHPYQDFGTTHLPWSAAHHVIARAPCPVLTIRE